MPPTRQHTCVSISAGALAAADGVETGAVRPARRQAVGRPAREPFLTDVVLTDGGVYDNLGLETAWKHYKTILVSDGGGKMQAEAEPKGDWARHALRINDRDTAGSDHDGGRSRTFAIS